MSILDGLKVIIQRRRAPDPAQRYIEEATSPADLEMRHREVDRGRFRGR